LGLWGMYKQPWQAAEAVPGALVPSAPTFVSPRNLQVMPLRAQKRVKSATSRPAAGNLETEGSSG